VRQGPTARRQGRRPRKSLWIAHLAAVGLLAASPPSAPACDSTACLMQTRGNNGVPRRGAWTMDLSFRYTDQSVGMEGSQRVDVVRRPWVDFERQHVWPRFHREADGVDRFYQVDAVVGVGWNSAVQVSLPVYAGRTYSIVHGADPFTYQTHGLGDMVVGFRRALGGPVVAGLAVKLPTGRSDLQDRYSTYILDPMLQPGTGSWDAVGSVQATHRVAGLDGTVSASYQLTGASERDYRFGGTLVAAVSARRSIGGPVSASLQVKGVYQGRSTFLGEGVPSTGGTMVYVNPGLQVSVPRSGTVYAYVPVPAYRDVKEQQLTPRFSLLFGVAKTF
jgi:hypothetical protein